MLKRYYPLKPIKPWKGPKPKLQMVVTREYRVHYQALQAYLAKVYGMQACDILQTMGLTSGVGYEHRVTGQMPPISNIGQQTDDIRRGRWPRNLGLVLNVLCEDGFIPKGKYVIDTTPPPSPITAYTRLLNERQDPNHQDCVAFRNQQRSPNFKRRAQILDRRMMQYKEAD